MNLQLSLITKWFELSEPDQKTEDYRSITPYWAKRFFLYQEENIGKCLTDAEIEEICEDLNNANNCMGELEEEISFVLDNWYLSFKKFTTNTLTKGYPPKEDLTRKKVYEHKGIEISTGREEWGAEPGKLYFVIKHGKRL